MPAPLDVDREQVRMLVLRVGCTEASQELGIPLNTILSWSARGKWLKPEKPELPPTVQPRAISTIKPSQALANIMERRKEKVNDHLSRYLVNASKVASRSRAPLRVAQNVRHVAAIKQAVYPEPVNAPGITLNVLNTAGAMA